MTVGGAVSEREVPGQRFAVLVGVSVFQDPRLHPLKFARADVEGLKEVLEGGRSFEEIKVLLDEQATRTAVLAAIKEIVDRIGTGDLLFLYFSTHGVRHGDLSY